MNVLTMATTKRISSVNSSTSLFTTTVPNSEQLEPCHILRPLGYYLIVVWILGTTLNGTMLYVLLRYKKIRQSPTNVLIGGLIVADLIGAFFEVPMPAFSLIACRWLFAYFGCVTEAIIAYFAGCSNMYMLCLISIDRYMMIVKNTRLVTMTVQRAYTSIACVYGLALFWTLLPVMGWSYYDYEGTGASCSIKWEERSANVISYNIIILIMIFLIPVTIILFTNLKVYKMIRHHTRRNTIILNDPHTRRRSRFEQRLVQTIVFVIAGYLFAWTPYAVASCIRMVVDSQHFPPLFGTLPSVFAKTSLLWNPLVYVVRNRNFRKYIPFFRFQWRCKAREIPGDTQLYIYRYSVVPAPGPQQPSFHERQLQL